MPWGRLDDSLYDHPKLDDLPADAEVLESFEDAHDDLLRLAALGLWARSVSYSNRHLTDGILTRSAVIRKLGGTSELADALVIAGLFERTATGYAIHDFLDFNDSRADVLARRQYDANRKAAQRAAKASGRSPGGTSNGTGADVQSESERSPAGVPRSARPHARGRAPATRPDPTRPSSTPQPPASGGRRSNGTSPRQVAAKAAASAAETEGAKRYRRNQRHLAYLRGAIDGETQRAMDAADTPLEEIPGWAEYLEAKRAEADSDGPIAEAAAAKAGEDWA
jgi:hypothetical protein